MGYMTNASDDVNMENAAFQQQMVQGIANGIDTYFGF
jgi:N-acetylmuramoyl-L-alanine amidase